MTTENKITESRRDRQGDEERSRDRVGPSRFRASRYFLE